MSWSFSSTTIRQVWRFSLEKDFRDPSGEPFAYAEGGHQQWDDEAQNISIEKHTTEYALSHDNQYLALGQGRNIDIYTTTDLRRVQTLKGHVTDVASVYFRPGASCELVSSSSSWSNDRRREEPLIIFRNLDQYKSSALVETGAIDHLTQCAVQAVAAEFKTNFATIADFTSEDEQQLSEIFRPHLDDFATAKAITTQKRLVGRLCKNEVFSPSGRMMLWMPGSRPVSNDIDHDWVIRLRSVDNDTDMWTLAGHVDTIMWAGFNPDETLVGTCAWDRSIRIWNVDDGRLKYQFETDGQNWTGGFSPNGKYFAGTVGSGDVHVYNLNDGTRNMTVNGSKDWCRSLSWHPQSTFLASGDAVGKLYLIDIERAEIVQVRKVSGDKCKVPPERRKIIQRMTEVRSVQFMDGGRKILFVTGGDESAEVYDIEKCCKWRFARRGTEDEGDSEGADEDFHEFVSGQPVAWEDEAQGKITILTIDGDKKIRMWSVPMTV